MERVKETLLGPSTLSYRQAGIILILCSTYISYIPSRGFINTISQYQDTDYLNTYFTFYGIAFILGSIINAILIDKIGSKSSLIFFAITLSISIFSLAMIQKLSTHLPIAVYILLALNAISSSSIFPSIAKFIYTYFYPSQYDILFILIALSAHITSLITSFNINFLMQSSSNILLNTTYITIFGIVIFTILSMILKKDKDEKWFLSPITVYDIKQNKFEKHFCKRQIMLLADIKHNKSIKTNNNIPYVHTISDDDEKEYDEEDRVYLQLQRRQLRVEMDAFIKNKPKLMRNNKFNKIYLLLILSMCFLSLMNCFHVFSFSILKAILPSIYYHYGDKYNLNSIKTISSMLQIGMIFALILALFYRYYSNQSIYGQYKCSAVLVKLSIAISAILSVVIWLIECSALHPGTSSTVVLLFDILFFLYGICISYPIHVFCYVYLLSISGYNAGLVFSILNVCMFLVSILYSIIVSKFGDFIGWQWISVLFIGISIGTAYFYQKLNNTQSIMNILQEGQLLKIMQKNKFIKEEYKSFWFDSVSNETDTSNDDVKIQLN